MIAMVAWIFAEMTTIWHQNTTGCSMTAIAIVMGIVVVGTMGGRMAKKNMDDPGAMTSEELEQKMIDEAW